jgi:hypothetical protein
MGGKSRMFGRENQADIISFDIMRLRQYPSRPAEADRRRSDHPLAIGSDCEVQRVVVGEIEIEAGGSARRLFDCRVITSIKDESIIDAIR